MYLLLFTVFSSLMTSSHMPHPLSHVRASLRNSLTVNTTAKARLKTTRILENDLLEIDKLTEQ